MSKETYFSEWDFDFLGTVLGSQDSSRIQTHIPTESQPPSSSFSTPKNTPAVVSKNPEHSKTTLSRSSYEYFPSRQFKHPPISTYVNALWFYGSVSMTSQISELCLAFVVEMVGKRNLPKNTIPLENLSSADRILWEYIQKRLCNEQRRRRVFDLIDTLDDGPYSRRFLYFFFVFYVYVNRIVYYIDKRQYPYRIVEGSFGCGEHRPSLEAIERGERVKLVNLWHYNKNNYTNCHAPYRRHHSVYAFGRELNLRETVWAIYVDNVCGLEALKLIEADVRKAKIQHDAESRLRRKQAHYKQTKVTSSGRNANKDIEVKRFRRPSTMALTLPSVSSSQTPDGTTKKNWFEKAHQASSSTAAPPPPPAVTGRKRLRKRQRSGQQKLTIRMG